MEVAALFFDDLLEHVGGCAAGNVLIYKQDAAGLFERFADHAGQVEERLALMMNAQDYDQTFPKDPEKVTKAIEPYLKDPQAFSPPYQPDRQVFEWVPPPSLKMAEIAAPAQTVIGKMAYRPEFTLLLFADGHVKVQRPSHDQEEQE